MELKKVALNDTHIALNAKMVPFAGFNMPVRYSSDKDEHNAVRKNVGIFDVSHMGEFMVEGESALDLIQYVTSNDASKLENGQAQYSCLPNHEGGIVDDLLVYKFNDEKYMLVVNAGNIQKDWDWIMRQNTFGATLENISDSISLFAIQGPKAEAVLSQITDVDLSAMKYYTFLKGNIGNITGGAIFSATGYTGAGGFEIYVYNEFAAATWNLIMEKGAAYDIKPIGLGARDTLRLEMGFCLYGNDIDDHTSPLEAGLGWITKFNKSFINSEDLLKQKEEGIKRKLIGFEMSDKGIPRPGYKILNANGHTIGLVTSGTMSPSMDKGIGMGYIEIGYKDPGTEIFIEIRNKNHSATIVKMPIYKG